MVIWQCYGRHVFQWYRSGYVLNVPCLSLSSDCQWATVRLVKCLSVNGVASVVDVVSRPHLQIGLGIVILSPRLRQNATKSLAKLISQVNKQFTHYRHLLVALRRNNSIFIRFPNKNANATLLLWNLPIGNAKILTIQRPECLNCATV